MDSFPQMKDPPGNTARGQNATMNANTGGMSVWWNKMNFVSRERYNLFPIAASMAA